MTSNFDITVIKNIDKFILLKTAWNNLANRSKDTCPFLCHEWFSVWLNNFIHDNLIFIVSLSKDDKVLTIVPFIEKKDIFRGVKVKMLELIGNVYSPFRSLIFDSVDTINTNEALDAFFLTIKAKSDLSWDIIDFNSIPEENPFMGIARDCLASYNLKFSEHLCFGDWYQDSIKCSGDEYLANIPSNLRKDFQYCKRRLQREGTLDFIVVYSTENLDCYLDMYYEVYGKSWQKQERVGPTFHRDLAKMAAEKGWLRLSFLIHNGFPIAAQFWIISGTSAYILKTVYDQKYKKYSAGKVLTSEMFRYVIDIDKITTIDYVQGDEEYKKDWTPKRRERRGLKVYNTTWRGRYLYFIDSKIISVMRNNCYLKGLMLLLSRIANFIGNL